MRTGCTLQAYAKKRGVDPASLKLIYDGIVITDMTKTPKDLEMEDGAMVEAMLDQVSSESCSEGLIPDKIRPSTASCSNLCVVSPSCCHVPSLLHALQVAGGPGVALL